VRTACSAWGFGGVLRASWAIAVCASLAGCSTKDRTQEADDAGDAGDAGDAAAYAGPQIALAFSGHVLPDTQLYSCTFVAMPAQPVYITGFSHTYSTGYHHLYIYETDLTSFPDSGGTATDCYGQTDPMAHARANIYAQEVTSGSFTFPSGVALPSAPGQVLLVQAHYLNATANAIDASASLSIEYATSDPGQHAGAYFFYDPFIDVGPESESTATMRCLVPSSVTVLTTVGSSHQRAIGYEAYVDTPTMVGANPYYHADGWSDALPLVFSLPIPEGDHVRYLCTYDNSSNPTEYLQGIPAATSEQCILSGLYFPEQGTTFDACESADEMGTGTAACPATSACVAKCPPGSSPPYNLGLAGEPAINPCWQRCMVASCPDTFSLLFSLRACLAAQCAGECDSDAGDAGSACAACGQAHCATENSACAADPCQ
jgi:hypothetical protein